MAIPTYPPVPRDSSDERAHRAQLADAVNRLNQGKFNAVTTVTLAVSSTTTTLIDPRIGYFTFAAFTPTTADAAAAMAGLYVSAKLKGSLTITHASATSTDRAFDVLLIG